MVCGQPKPRKGHNMITIKRFGKNVKVELYEDDKLVKTFTCGRQTNDQAIKLCIELHQLINDNHGFVAICNMMEYDKI